jgi:type 1 fimbria pilin
LSDEVEGKSVTTKATVSCTGGSSYGTVNIALSLSDEKVNLKDDDSLYARLDLNGNGTTTTASVDINSSTTLNVTSTLYTNGNVSSGAFSGSSVLTMTYY